jgi:hypothetical protein
MHRDLLCVEKMVDAGGWLMRQDDRYPGRGTLVCSTRAMQWSNLGAVCGAIHSRSFLSIFLPGTTTCPVHSSVHENLALFSWRPAPESRVLATLNCTCTTQSLLYMYRLILGSQS